MKAPLVFFMVFLIAACPVLAESFKISIKVDNPVEQEIAIYYYKNKNADSPSIAKIYLGDSDQVEFMFDLQEDQLVNIHYGKDVIPVFMAVPHDLKMHFDAKNIWKSLHFEGEGATNNKFLADFHQKFPPQEITQFEAGYVSIDFPAELLSKFQTTTPDAFRKNIADREVAQKAFFKQQKHIPEDLVQKFERKAKYENAVELLMYHVCNQPYWKEGEMHAEKDKNKAFRWGKYKDENLIAEKYYQNFLKAYLFYSFLPGNLDDFDIVNLLYDHANKHLKKQAKFWLQAELMIRQYDRTGRTRLAKKHFNTYYEENPYPEFSQRVIDTYGMDLDFVPQTAAPDFATVDSDGKTVTLADFKGKVVYISFWATWCKPCLKGFAQSEYLRKDLMDMGIILLNVSLDKEAEVWQKTLKKHKIIGQNVLAPDMEAVQKTYGLATLPAYHIVGKDGRFCYLSDKEGRNILEEFRGFLKKK